MIHKTPGVYIEEISNFPPSIAQVETAIPAFIGYTELAVDETNISLLNEPKRITSLLEYKRFFGAPFVETGLVVSIMDNAPNPRDIMASIIDPSCYKMHYALQMFFANGGGPCWVVSVGNYALPSPTLVNLQTGLKATEKIDEITLYVYPDTQHLGTAIDFYTLFSETMTMCAKLQDRFAVMDIWPEPGQTDLIANVELMRSNTTSEEYILKYGATYFPNLITTLNYYYGDEGNVLIEHHGGDGSLNGSLAELKSKNTLLYSQALQALQNIPLEMPPSPGVVGVYAAVDKSRGVWKAPANVNIAYVSKPVIAVTDEQQNNLNVDVNAGKSVNVIRLFVGRGNAIIWGSRTLAGNSNEWRYVPVRRFFNMVGESVKKATIRFVFEPNNLNTWSMVKAMINTFLVQQWRAGALMGTTTDKAFYVRIGLNETMDEVDIAEGRMIVEIGMAVVRPAEFIILKFSHKMLSE